MAEGLSIDKLLSASESDNGPTRLRVDRRVLDRVRGRNNRSKPLRSDNMATGVDHDDDNSSADDLVKSIVSKYKNRHVPAQYRQFEPSTLAPERAQLTQAIDALSHDNHLLREENYRLERKVKDLSAFVKSKRSEKSNSQELRQELESTRTELESTRSDFTTVRNDLTASQDEVKALRTELDAVRAELAAARLDLKQARESLPEQTNTPSQQPIPNSLETPLMEQVHVPFNSTPVSRPTSFNRVESPSPMELTSAIDQLRSSFEQLVVAIREHQGQEPDIQVHLPYPVHSPAQQMPRRSVSPSQEAQPGHPPHSSPQPMTPNLKEQPQYGELFELFGQLLRDLISNAADQRSTHNEPGAIPQPSSNSTSVTLDELSRNIIPKTELADTDGNLTVPEDVLKKFLVTLNGVDESGYAHLIAKLRSKSEQAPTLNNYVANVLDDL